MFADHEPADSYDPTATVDPYQVAAYLHRVARDLRVLARVEPGPRFDELAEHDIGIAVAIVTHLLSRLTREGALRTGI